MKIELREPRDIPVWLHVSSGNFTDCVNHYREELPSQMTGGRIMRSIQTTIDGAEIALDISNDRELERALGASLLVVRGLGTCNIVLSRSVFASESLERFVTALQSAGACISLDWCDNLTARGTERFFLDAFRANLFGDFARRYPLSPHWAEVCYQIIWENPLKKLFANNRASGLFRTFKRHIVVTRELERVALERYAADVRIAPNAIRPEDFTPTVRAPSPVRVGHAGTAHHWGDLKALGLVALLKCAESGAEVHFFGASNVLDAPRAHHHGLLKGPKFNREIGILDVAILPLVSNDSNDCKSAQRWFEHSAHRTACVVSDLPPYDCVEHGITGFKARTAEEFTEYAVRLCRDAELRKRIGDAAHNYAMTHHTITACAEQWRAAVG